MAQAHEKARTLPELLAPAGDEDALRAALHAGADAVYFGLAEGFNARARAGNFSLENLSATVARVHRAGARAFLALNTLIFESELSFVEQVVVAAAASGVDALIVQDPALALIARAVCPELEVHASTQMTISSAESARFAASLGVKRIVVPRELSVAEIRHLRAGTELELEVFVHGALCVAWSGQCLTSATWSGRSANRGECAQSCRLPYDLVVDGKARELDDVKYLLSPKDLAGLRALAELVDIGVHGLKIEGRQKSAQYVLTATESYRHGLEALRTSAAEHAPALAERDLLRASLSYTRGFSDGFLGGSDHQTLVEGRFPKHRGVYLGRVTRVDASTVYVERDDAGRPWTGALASDTPRGVARGTPSAALHGFGGAADASVGPRAAALEPKAGMGVVFDAGRPEDKQEPGGPIFRVEPTRNGWSLGFGTPGPDLERVAIGQRVWISGDPALARETLRALSAPEPSGRIRLDLSVHGSSGAALVVEARAGRASARATSATPLARAQAAGLDERVLLEKLGALGGTPFALGTLDARALERGLHLPVSELKTMRRQLVDALVPELERGAPRTLAGASVLADLRRPVPPRAATHAPQLVALCRNEAQLEAALELGLAEVELDWMELVGLARAVERARAAGVRVVLATLRVQKPGEESFDQRLAALQPDGVLVRHWGALVHFREQARGAPLQLHGDFSLNVTNSITAGELLCAGLDTLTPSHDLDADQLRALLAAVPPSRFTLVLQHRMPTFHTEHCVYAHLLSNGRDFRTCGRPCESHQIALRDPRRREHPVIVDVGCRNTVFDADVQSSAALVPELRRLGVTRFRVELVREDRAQVAQILHAYRELLSGRASVDDTLERLGAVGRVGLSDTKMSVMR